MNASPLSWAGNETAFLLISTAAFPSAEQGAIEEELRRMGLQPQLALSVSPEFGAATSGPAWQIRFGQWQFLIGLAKQDGWLAQNSFGDAAITGTAPTLAGGARQHFLLCPLAGNAAAHGIAVVRAQLKVAVLVADIVSADKIFWWPAKLWSEIGKFRLAVTEMLDSGMPPLLHLVAFIEGVENAVLATRGLTIFCGQELRLVEAGHLSRADQGRRLARLALDMMMNGRISARSSFSGLLADETIFVEPLAVSDSEGSAILSVWIECE